MEKRRKLFQVGEQTTTTTSSVVHNVAVSFAPFVEAGNAPVPH